MGFYPGFLFGKFLGFRVGPGIVGPAAIRVRLAGFHHVANDEIAVHILKIPDFRIVDQLRIDAVAIEQCLIPLHLVLDEVVLVGNGGEGHGLPAPIACNAETSTKTVTLIDAIGAFDLLTLQGFTLFKYLLIL